MSGLITQGIAKSASRTLSAKGSNTLIDIARIEWRTTGATERRKTKKDSITAEST